MKFVASRSELIGKKVQTALALAIYLALSAFFFGIGTLGHPGYRFIGGRADALIEIWALAWWPHALLPILIHSSRMFCGRPWVTTSRGRRVFWRRVLHSTQLHAYTVRFSPTICYAWSVQPPLHHQHSSSVAMFPAGSGPHYWEAISSASRHTCSRTFVVIYSFCLFFRSRY